MSEWCPQHTGERHLWIAIPDTDKKYCAYCGEIADNEKEGK